MTAPPDDQDALVNVDAGDVYAHPYAIVLVITYVAGLMDAVAFERFGVFTANQAGNLVVAWTMLPDAPATALLSVASIVGCGLGVATIVLLRRAMPGLRGRAGSRGLLVGAAGLIVLAGVVGSAVRVTSTAQGPISPDLGTSGWWAAAGSVSLSAFSLAVLAAVFVSGGGGRAPILASTNSYVDAVRFGVAATFRGSPPDWGRAARRAAGFPIAWSVGAASTVLLPFTYVGFAVTAAAIVIAVAMLARRVNDSTADRRRTV